MFSRSDTSKASLSSSSTTCVGSLLHPSFLQASYLLMPATTSKPSSEGRTTIGSRSPLSWMESMSSDICPESVLRAILEGRIMRTSMDSKKPASGLAFMNRTNGVLVLSTLPNRFGIRRFTDEPLRRRGAPGDHASPREVPYSEWHRQGLGLRLGPREGD